MLKREISQSKNLDSKLGVATRKTLEQDSKYRLLGQYFPEDFSNAILK
jgi:hypothetical protein